MPRISAQTLQIFGQDYEEQLQSSKESRTGDQLSAVAKGHKVDSGHRKQWRLPTVGDLKLRRSYLEQLWDLMLFNNRTDSLFAMEWFWSKAIQIQN